MTHMIANTVQFYIFSRITKNDLFKVNRGNFQENTRLCSMTEYAGHVQQLDSQN